MKFTGSIQGILGSCTVTEFINVIAFSEAAVSTHLVPLPGIKSKLGNLPLQAPSPNAASAPPPTVNHAHQYRSFATLRSAQSPSVTSRAEIKTKRPNILGILRKTFRGPVALRASVDIERRLSR
jgi:hypothetical protein